ncbi:MAG TPA: MmcQ/YjbR family DNA-binding protein [Steroidobacteraceae bacterium]
MATRTREDRRLRLLSAVCLALPEAERTLCGAHADFRVHGKIFAYYLRNHGGNGITAACVKARLGEHVQHVKRAPTRFYLPQFIGRRGWFGVRLDQGDIDWDEVKALVVVSYNLAAPQNLRTALAPVANALTARSLVRGAPAPELAVSRVTAQLVDAKAVNAARLAEEQVKRDTALRPPAMPGAAVSQSGGIRNRR